MIIIININKLYEELREIRRNETININNNTINTQFKCMNE